MFRVGSNRSWYVAFSHADRLFDVEEEFGSRFDVHRLAKGARNEAVDNGTYLLVVLLLYKKDNVLAVDLADTEEDILGIHCLIDRKELPECLRFCLSSSIPLSPSTKIT